MNPGPVLKLGESDFVLRGCQATIHTLYQKQGPSTYVTYAIPVPQFHGPCAWRNLIVDGEKER